MIETLLGGLGVLVNVLIIVALVTIIITKRSDKTSNVSPKNTYYGKLESGDSSIEYDTKNLELTNSRYLKNNGRDNKKGTRINEKQ